MKHYLHGRPQITGRSLCPPPPPAHALHIAPLDTTAAAGPNVEVVKQGDKVIRLIVTCSCGERTEIECLYPNGG